MTRTREWLKFAAVAMAMASVIAGYAAVDAPNRRSPVTESYTNLDFSFQSMRDVLLVTALAASLVSLALAAVGRTALGAMAGAGAFVFVALVVPGLMPACCGGGESSVIGLLRAINSSQQAYSSACAAGQFASTLETLTTPPVGSSAAFISDDAAKGLWYGYRVAMRIPEGATVADVVACNGPARVTSSYFVEAHPIETGTGRRTFATDERGTIYQNRDGTIIQPGMAGAEVVQ